MILARYDTYKDSGLELMCKIPKHWELKRLKDLGSLQNGISQGKEYFGFGYPFVSYGNVYNDKIELKYIDGLANSSKEDQKLYSVLEGDIFFTRTSETIDEIGISATALQTIKKATFSGFLIRLRPNKNKILKGFSNYFFKANINRLFLSKEISLVTRASLSQNKLNNLPVLLPNKAEQTAIALYLDRKTSAIDRKVSLLEQKITHYQKLRKSLINETVCRGLDKNVKLKDSEIEWIGKIPAHWEVKRLKECLRANITDGPHETPDFVDDGYPFISVDGIVDGELYFENCRYISEEDYKRFSKKVNIELNDLFIGKAASTGKIARVKVDFKFTIWSPIAVIKISKKLSPIFIEYFMKSEAVQPQIENLCTHNTQNNIAMKDIPKIMLAIPPHLEQCAINEYLDEKTQKIDSIVSNILVQISTLKELRKTLINDVVTGKLKVEGIKEETPLLGRRRTKDAILDGVEQM